MKSIKVIPSNKAAIEAALQGANGKATGHTYTTNVEIGVSKKWQKVDLLTCFSRQSGELARSL